jgi:hypothetical protein
MDYKTIPNDSVPYENSGVLKYYNSVYDNINELNNNNLIDQHNAKHNLYNYKKVKMYNNVLYVVMITCVILLLLTFLHKNNNYFDGTAYLIIVAIFLGIAVCYILYLLKDIIFRDNMNFDEYDYNRYGSGSPVDISFNDTSDTSDTSNTDISGAKCKNKKGNTFLSFF